MGKLQNIFKSIKERLITRTSKNEVGKDSELIRRIAPQGGVSFRHEKFVSTGKGYETSIYIYEYPHEIDYNWLFKLTNQDDTLFSMDISSVDRLKIKQNLNRTMEEQQGRINNARTNAEAISASKQFHESADLYREIENYGAIMKRIVSRIYVPAKTLVECDKKTSDIMADLAGSNYKSTVCLDETKADFTSAFLSFGEQRKSIYGRKGQGLLSSTLAIGNPFHFSKLNDPQGFYFGTTETGGSVILDLFRITKRRNSYDAVVTGKKGSGKSSLLKKMAVDRVIRNDFVRVFDAANEFTSLFKALGAPIIDLSGAEGKINALQILPNSESDKVSFTNGLAKISTIYKYIKPSVDANEILVLKKLLRILYMDYGIITSTGEPTRPFSEFKANEFPTWSDFRNLLKKNLIETMLTDSLEKVEEDEDEDNNQLLITNASEYLSSILLVVEDICTTYKDVFDGHTTIADFNNEPMVSFNTANLVSYESTIFDALTFQALSLCWDSCVSSGRKMKELYDKGQIDWRDIRRSMIVLDEAHRVVNANKPAALEQLMLFSNEGRKWFVSLVMASPSIRNFVPEGSDSVSIEKMKTLFENSTYKFIFRQDSNAKGRLQEIFEGEFTSSEIDDVPNFEQGDTLLSVGGEETIKFHVDLSPTEIELFSGGA